MRMADQRSAAEIDNFERGGDEMSEADHDLSDYLKGVGAKRQRRDRRPELYWKRTTPAPASDAGEIEKPDAAILARWRGGTMKGSL